MRENILQRTIFDVLVGDHLTFFQAVRSGLGKPRGCSMRSSVCSCLSPPLPLPSEIGWAWALEKRTNRIMEAENNVI